jgi:thiamine-phosphate pyrophosphorylase
MDNKPVRYAITDLSALTSSSPLDAAETRRLRLLADLRRWADVGVSVVQLREKGLQAGEVFVLADTAVRFLQGLSAPFRPRLLINSRADIAVAARADGVHLTAAPGELTPAQARAVFDAAGLPPPLVSQSCHTPEEVTAARAFGPDLLLFGPVFGKTLRGELVTVATGLAQLAAACQAARPCPVLALGGITPENTDSCLRAGAAGVAGIRLFS